jgi:acyl carrier protein
MVPQETILRTIYDAIDEINASFPDERQVTKSPDTILFGKSGQLDSLGLVNLVVTVESMLESETGTSVTLADEKAMSQTHSPFRTVSALADYIAGILNTDASP